ncbi:hypothetical protein G7Y89_g1770 [Cudoniella acicularis]|uniref:Uncharacterized protein n=1 Tax=Cudoniella acicularis TaxID=354080 RepID=A0A8H4RVN8_9HELO|nr:hypothetical protein G7Y89_g1770 [Cudoniella acicularis]
MKRDGPTNSSNSDHVVIAIDEIERDGCKGWSIVWKTIGIPGGDWVLRAERVQEVIETKSEDGILQTEYRTWGTFGGPMAYLLDWMCTKADIVDRFKDWVDGLKKEAESVEHNSTP